MSPHACLSSQQMACQQRQSGKKLRFLQPSFFITLYQGDKHINFIKPAMVDATGVPMFGRTPFMVRNLRFPTTFSYLYSIIRTRTAPFINLQPFRLAITVDLMIAMDYRLFLKEQEEL